MGGEGARSWGSGSSKPRDRGPWAWLFTTPPPLITTQGSRTAPGTNPAAGSFASRALSSRIFGSTPFSLAPASVRLGPSAGLGVPLGGRAAGGRPLDRYQQL